MVVYFSNTLYICVDSRNIFDRLISKAQEFCSGNDYKMRVEYDCRFGIIHAQSNIIAVRLLAILTDNNAETSKSGFQIQIGNPSSAIDENAKKVKGNLVSGLVMDNRLPKSGNITI